MYSEQEIIKLCKPFAVLFIFSFLIINWTDVSWIFNYRVMSGIALSPFQSADAEDGVTRVKEEDSFTDLAVAGDEASEIAASRKSAPPSDEAGGEIAASGSNPPRNDARARDEAQISLSDSIKIPKIGISAPLIFVSNSNNQYLHDKLDSGVVHYPGSVKPGENGETIVLGHSAPPNWPKIKYDWVFSRLNELNPGDQIILNYNNQKYVYSVIRKVFLNKGQEMPKSDLTNNNNTLISISCWPPGKDYKRIAVESILID